MAIPTSGPISFSQLRDEFGGPSSNVSLSSYYRGQGLVPGTVPRTTYTNRVPTTGENYDGSLWYWRVITHGYPSVHSVSLYINFGGALIIVAEQEPLDPWDNKLTWTSYYLPGGTNYVYFRGATKAGSGVPDENGDVTTDYAVYRQTRTTQQTTVNQDVPTSGAISLSNFRGATKT